MSVEIDQPDNIVIVSSENEEEKESVAPLSRKKVNRNRRVKKRRLSGDNLLGACSHEFNLSKNSSNCKVP